MLDQESAHEKSFKRSDSKQFLDLFATRPWLEKIENEFTDLLSEAKDQNEKDLIFELIARFSYLTTDEMAQLLDLKVKGIISRYKEDEVIIAAQTIETESDSGQKMLDILKIPLEKNGWSDCLLLNRLDAVKKRITEKRKHIIVIDEFIGSGKTTLARNKHMRTLLSDKTYTIEFHYLAGMEHALNSMAEDEISVYCERILKKGISDYFQGEFLDSAKSKMLSLESRLAPSVKRSKLSDFSFGYEKSETLYTLDASIGSIPNNVFPIFWWPESINGKRRRMFVRRQK